MIGKYCASFSQASNRAATRHKSVGIGDLGEDTGSRTHERWFAGAMVLIVVAFFTIGAIVTDPHTPSRSVLVVYGFSTQEEALAQGVFPAFEAAWQAETGQNLTIEGVFGPSATLARQIVLGAPADVALFSNIQHVAWLKVGRRIQERTQPTVFGCTPIVIVARPGNPAGITEFADLAQPGLRLLHADPRNSGAGEWAILAAYGNALLGAGGGDRVAAEMQLKAIWRNVRLMGPSARGALTLFELGAGDALVTYEQDARLALERGVALEIVAPPRTIVARYAAVIVDDNVTSAERPVAQAFVDFIASDAGRQILSRYHLRPGTCVGGDFPSLDRPFTVEDLGGWPHAYAQLIDSLWQTEIEPRLDLGTKPKLTETED